MVTIDRMIEENIRRNQYLDAPYDPVWGIGGPIERQELVFSDMEKPFNLPLSMFEVDWIKELAEYKSISDAATGFGTDVNGLMEYFVDERFEHDFEFWAITTIKITHKETFQPIPFKLRVAQRILLAELEKMRLAGVPIRIVLLKARQWGGSTLVQIYMMWIQQIHRKNWHLAVVAQDDSAAKNISGMYTQAAEYYPKEFGTITLAPYERSSKNRQSKERGGIIGVGSINNPDQFRSFNYAMNHLCIHPKTEIPTKDGFIKFAKDISVGDEIITHTGEKAKVSCVTISKPNEINGNGLAYEIKAWGQQPLILTPNHPVFTKRGWIKSEDLLTTDLVSFPVRKITHNIKSIQLPEYVNTRKQKGGTIPQGSGKTLIIDREIGYAFGYYLAEGSVHIRKNLYNEVTFSRDVDDGHLSKRAIAALSFVSNKISSSKHKNSRTVNDIIGDAILAKFMFDTFNMKEFKTIPDWFFDCGEEFLKGVVIGYLSGDGTKSNESQGKYKLASVRATSISTSIANQIRDIIIALGIGISSLDIKESGNYFGRNCKRAYINRYSGSNARELRKLLKHEITNNHSHTFTEKSFIEDGFVWIKIRSIEKTTITEVVDIEVDHPDHSFRTISFSVKNSEVGIWQDTPKRTAQDLITSLKETVPDVPYSLIVEESTAKGLNYFYESWKRAVKGETRYKAVFIPWFMIDRDRIPIDIPIQEFVNKMSDYDKTLWSLGATLEGINWYNKHKKDRYEQADSQNQMFSEWQMQQENPSTPSEAFNSAGEKRFNPLYIKAMEQDCMPPVFVGSVRADASIGEKAFDNIEFVPDPKGKLSIWTMPDYSVKVSDRYVIYVDIGGVWKGADYSVIKVVDRYWMMEGGDPEVVAVWYGHIDKDLLGWIAAQIGAMYDYALLAFETNSYDKDRNKDDHHMTVVERIADFYPNLYIRNNPEKVGSDFVPIYGWHMNKKTKPMVIDSLYAASRERYNKDLHKQDGYCLIERDVRVIKEMNWFEKKEDGTLGAMEGEHDDHVDTTAGVFHIATEIMPMPVLIENTGDRKKRIMRSEASF